MSDIQNETVRPEEQKPKKSKSFLGTLIKITCISAAIICISIPIIKLIYTSYKIEPFEYKETFLTWRLKYADGHMFNNEWRFKNLNKYDTNDKEKEGPFYKFVQGHHDLLQKQKDEYIEATKKLSKNEATTKRTELNEKFRTETLLKEIENNDNRNYETEACIGVLNNTMLNYFPRDQHGLMTYFPIFKKMKIQNQDQKKEFDSYMVEYLMWRHLFSFHRGDHISMNAAVGCYLSSDKRKKIVGERKEDGVLLVQDLYEKAPQFIKDLSKSLYELLKLIDTRAEKKTQEEITQYEKDVYGKIIEIISMMQLNNDILSSNHKIKIDQDWIKKQIDSMGSANPKIWSRVFYGHLVELFYLLTLDTPIFQNENGLPVTLTKINEGKKDEDKKSEADALFDFNSTRYKLVAKCFSVHFSKIYGVDYQEKYDNQGSWGKLMRKMFGIKKMKKQSFDAQLPIYTATMTELLATMDALVNNNNAE